MPAAPQTSPAALPKMPTSRDPIADILWKEAANHCDTLPGLLNEFRDYVKPLEAKQGQYLIKGGRRLEVDAEGDSFRITNPPQDGFVTLRNKADGSGVLPLTCVLMEILKNQRDNGRCFQDALAWIRKHYPQVDGYKPTAEEVAARRKQLDEKQHADKARHQRDLEAWRHRVASLDTIQLLGCLGYNDYSKDSERQWHFKVDDHTVNVRVDGSAGFAFGVLSGSARTTFASCQGKGGSRGNLALVKLIMEIKGHGSDEPSCYAAARTWLNQMYPHLDVESLPAGQAKDFVLKANSYTPPPKEVDTRVNPQRVPTKHTGDAVDQSCRAYLAKRGLSRETIDTFYRQGFFYSSLSLHKASEGPVLCSPIQGWETGLMVGVAIKPAAGQGAKGGKSKGINEGRPARGGIVFGDPSTADTVWLTEAAVDVASFYELKKADHPKSAYVAMTGARIPGPDHIDAFFRTFPNARTFVGAFNNDQVGRDASQALADEAKKRGLNGRVEVPPQGEFVIDASTRGPAGIGEKALHEVLSWATAHQVPIGISNKPEDRLARRNRIERAYSDKEIPADRIDELDWQTIHVANTPESCALIHRLTREASATRSALPEAERNLYPKEFQAAPLNKDWNDVLRGEFKPVAVAGPWLPASAAHEDSAAANYLVKVKRVDPSLAVKLVKARIFYPHCIASPSSATNVAPRVTVNTPLADFDSGRPVGFVAESIPTTGAPSRSRTFGAPNHGASTLRRFDADTKQLVLTSSLESAAARVMLEPREKTRCIMGFVGDKVPERLLELCKERGIELTVAMDATPQGRALGDQIHRRALELGISPALLKREEPESHAVFGYPATPEGEVRRERAKAMLTKHEHTVKEFPTQDGIIRVTTENTREVEGLVNGPGRTDTAKKSMAELDRGVTSPGAAASLIELEDTKAATVEFIGTSWSHHVYSRSFDRDYDRTGPEKQVVAPATPKPAAPSGPQPGKSFAPTLPPAALPFLKSKGVPTPDAPDYDR